MPTRCRVHALQEVTFRALARCISFEGVVILVIVGFCSAPWGTWSYLDVAPGGGAGCTINQKMK